MQAKPATYLRWEAVIASLGMSASEYVRQNCGAFTDAELSRNLNQLGFKTNTNSVDKKRERMGIGKVLTHAHNYSPYDTNAPIGESSFARYDSPPTVTADRVAIFPDIQFPYHHHEFTNRVLGLCRAWNVRHCILAGDVIENSSLSRFDPAWAGAGNSGGIPDKVTDDLLDVMAKMKPKDAAGVRAVIEKHGRKTIDNADGVSEEWGYSKKPIAAIVAQFDEVVWVLGNHEGRLLRQMKSPFLPENLKQMFVGDDPKVTIAPYYYCLVVSKGVEWRVTHPKSSTKGDAKWYASKYLVNTIMCHNHHLVLQMDRSGKFFAVETGTMADESRLPYVAQRDTKGDAHILGATIIRDGKAWLLHADTDWALLNKI
mgnify:CR=1 FL=1